MYSVFQVTGMIEGFLGVWNFDYQIFCSRKFGEYFFRWLYLSRDFWGIQNNPKICACGSAHISWLCSSSNKVQLTLLRLGNLVLDFLDFFSQLLNTSEEQIFLNKFSSFNFGVIAEYPAHQIPYLKNYSCSHRGLHVLLCRIFKAKWVKRVHSHSCWKDNSY